MAVENSPFKIQDSSLDVGIEVMPHRSKGEHSKEQAWGEEDKAKTLREEEKTLKMKNRILTRYMERMTFPQTDETRQHRQWVMELLTSTRY